MRKVTSVAVALGLAASMLVGTSAAEATVTSIDGGGSSFAGGILNVCKVDFNYNGSHTKTYNKTGTQVTYSTTGGSGQGRSYFQAGTYAFGAADAGYATGDTKPSDLVYVPLVGGPIAIIFKNSDITGNRLKLSASVVSQIFKGTITNWNNSQITALNGGVALPSKAILPYYRSGSSGTSQNLVNWIKGMGVTGWTSDGTWATATGDSSPAGTSASSSSNLATAVDTNYGAIGYVDLKDAVGHTVAFASIKNALGQYIAPTVAASAKFLSRQVPSTSGLVTFKYKTGAVSGEYNVGVITYGLGHTKRSSYSSNATDATKIATTVKNFFTYSIGSCAAASAAGLKYNNLTGAIKTKALAQVAKIGATAN